jgi:VanZ family protein
MFRPSTRLLQAAFLAVALVAFTAAIWPDPVTTEAANADKALHFATFYILEFMALVAFTRVLPATIGLLAMGALIEVVQGFVGRDRSLWDFVADALGVLAVLLPQGVAAWRRRQKP